MLKTMSQKWLPRVTLTDGFTYPDFFQWSQDFVWPTLFGHVEMGKIVLAQTNVRIFLISTFWLQNVRFGHLTWNLKLADQRHRITL